MSVEWVVWCVCTALAAGVAGAGEGCGCTASRDPAPLHTRLALPYEASPAPTCPARAVGPAADATVHIPGGQHAVGTDQAAVEGDGEGPARRVTLPGFRLDRYEVSNAEFAEFVSASEYSSEAELFGDSFVFALLLNTTFREQLRDYRAAQAPWWYKVAGADWRHPDGPDSTLKGRWEHPVVHVSWRDAHEFCAWRGGRLPREAEWEAACRAGRRAARYPWGDKLFPNRTHMANIWQGSFPGFNSAKDGYVGTNPVHLFPQNELGLHNMAGNVWEWTEDSWSAGNPSERVKKGGSYLCHKSYCYRYRCAARSHNTLDSSAGNLGFRCAYRAP